MILARWIYFSYSSLFAIKLGSSCGGIQLTEFGAGKGWNCRSTVYLRMKQLAAAIQQHPWFDEITNHFRPIRRAVKAPPGAGRARTPPGLGSPAPHFLNACNAFLSHHYVT